MNMDPNTLVQNETYYEGCGQEGPLRCIFLSEFHHTEGPRIRCQVGDEVISKDVFDAINIYIIPKQQLAEQKITLNVLGYKISGYPIIIDDKKYKRNQFIFNLAFVCYPWSRTVQYEPAIKKLYKYLVNLELESEFVSREENTQELQSMMERILTDLNSGSRCLVSVGGPDTQQLQIKITHSAKEPPLVYDYDVPVLLVDWKKYYMKSWDLTTQELLEYMDGFNHVNKIANLADVETHLVKSDVANLVYHGVAKILPIFSYTDHYALTPKLRTLREDQEFKSDCINAIAIDPQHLPKFKDIYQFICSLSHGTNVKDAVLRKNPSKYGFCERKLIQFLLLNSVLRKIHNYPIYNPLGGSSSSMSQLNGDYDSPTTEGDLTSPSSVVLNESLYKWFDGSKHLDEISVKMGITPAELFEQIDNDPYVYVLKK